MARPGPVRRVAEPATDGVRDVGQGSPRADPWQETVCARAVGGSDRGRVARAGDKRAVLLVQLPPQLPRDDARLEYFLARLPGWVPVAVEFRHPSWVHDDVFDLLTRHRAAYCVMSGAGLPCVLRSTAAFVYVRMHGPDAHHLYGGSYSDADLCWWADRVREWTAMGKDVYVYFNNDGDGNAVRNADRLRALIGA